MHRVSHFPRQEWSKIKIERLQENTFSRLLLSSPGKLFLLFEILFHTLNTRVNRQMFTLGTKYPAFENDYQHFGLRTVEATLKASTLNPMSRRSSRVQICVYFVFVTIALVDWRLKILLFHFFLFVTFAELNFFRVAKVAKVEKVETFSIN